MVLHEDVAVAELGEAAAPGSAGAPSPRCPSLGLGTPAPGRGGCPPGRMEGAGCLPPLLLGALGHRLPSQPEDTAEQSITVWCLLFPALRMRSRGRAPPRLHMQLTRCRKERCSEPMSNTPPSSHAPEFQPSQLPLQDPTLLPASRWGSPCVPLDSPGQGLAAPVDGVGRAVLQPRLQHLLEQLLRAVLVLLRLAGREAALHVLLHVLRPVVRLPRQVPPGGGRACTAGWGAAPTPGPGPSSAPL